MEEQIINQILQELIAEISSLKKVVEELKPKKSEVVSTGEAAEMLGVSVHTIREWHNEDKMPKNVGQGKHIKYMRSDIERMIKPPKKGRPRNNLSRS